MAENPHSLYPTNRMSRSEAAIDRLLVLLAERAVDEWLRAQSIPAIPTKFQSHDDTRVHLRPVQHRPAGRNIARRPGQAVSDQVPDSGLGGRRGA